MRIWPGQPYPLGATWDGQGVNFAIFSQHATAIDLCLFTNADDAHESARVPMREQTDQVWHCYLPDVRPGQLYGYRAHGPYAPTLGHRFNPAQLLIDPYTKAVSGTIKWSNALFGYNVDSPRQDLDIDTHNSAGDLPKCVVVDSAFTWGNDQPPRIPWNRTMIYECHVRGMTIRHPDVPEQLRGKYLGLASDPIIEHLLRLGVTAIELLPVHHFAVDRALVERGLTNYWGYNSIAFFAPDVRYAMQGLGQQVNEFKSMVKVLHGAGIEVILDVVYNHTAEGNHLGPTLSLRGIDNKAYYRLNPNDPRYYVDFTGTGNSLNMLHPRAVQLVMDSLRYWVSEMHVDGFRFDLAPVLARELYEVNRLATFFDIVQQDPVLSHVKLIAEPWDVGPGGYHVGNFPVGWAEWNGKYRDAIRSFWRGDTGKIGELAFRLAGSSDIYEWSGRKPYASVNFVTCHDGFTLRDLVSYEHKHNQTNGEGNRDGTDDNISRNWGCEGFSDDASINQLRELAVRNFLATLAFSQGVPMLSHGDEIARTQGGNNNAYAQDNETSWMNWELDERQHRLLEFTRKLFAIRSGNPVLRRRGYFHGRPVTTTGVKDLSWFRADAREMTDEDWRNSKLTTLGMMIHGEAADEIDERGRSITGDTLLILVNNGDIQVLFTLPVPEHDGAWHVMLDTSKPEPTADTSNGAVMLMSFSLVLLRLVPADHSGHKAKRI